MLLGALSNSFLSIISGFREWLNLRRLLLAWVLGLWLGPVPFLSFLCDFYRLDQDTLFMFFDDNVGWPIQAILSCSHL